jgi:hypothetical protein
MELLWTLAADTRQAVLEANFWPDDPRLHARVAGLGVVPVEVHCQCPLEECWRRYTTRAASRHAVHLDVHPGRRPEDFGRSARPLGVGPLLVVDTTRPVDIAALAADVRERLAACTPATVSDL